MHLSFWLVLLVVYHSTRSNYWSNLSNTPPPFSLDKWYCCNRHSPPTWVDYSKSSLEHTASIIAASPHFIHKFINILGLCIKQSRFDIKKSSFDWSMYICFHLNGITSSCNPFVDGFTFKHHCPLSLLDSWQTSMDSMIPRFAIRTIYVTTPAQPMFLDLQPSLDLTWTHENHMLQSCHSLLSPCDHWVVVDIW